jgi:predicted Zn-dependent protease
MKTSELKKIVKECVTEILEEDDLISKIIIQAFKASESITRSQGVVREKVESSSSSKSSANTKDIWKKVVEAKRPSGDSVREYDFDPIEVKESKSSKPKQEFTLADLLKEDKQEEKIEIQEDKDLMNFFAKKFKK